MSGRASSSEAVGRQGTRYLDDTAQVVDAINALAASLAPELLPNGRKAGNKWMFSGIPDTGASESAWVNLSGSKIGHWCDAGNCAPGEEKGDMIDLLRLKLGLDARGAFEEARRRLGMPVSGERRELTQEEKQRRAAEAQARAEERAAAERDEFERKAKRARQLWLGAAPIAGTGGDFYLRGRGLVPGSTGQWPGSLRFHPEIYHGGLQIKLPAIVACIVTPEGRQIGTHRIFLQQDRQGRWRKLTGAPAKMVLGNQWGGFIPINKGSSGKPMSDMTEGEPIYVCEGPEDAVAIRMIKPEARIICSINLGNIGAIVLPRQARSLVIVADRDDKPAARDALETAIARQQARGVKVSIVMPPKAVGGVPVKDINDWVLALREASSSAAVGPAKNGQERAA
jgi:hypothetical protein